MASDLTNLDLIVVGGGMIGAAAARHAAEAGLTVAMIGAVEPPDWAASMGPFASHYDAGRITRIIDPDPLWAELAAASVARYADLEQRTGISFHDPVGLVWMKPKATASAALIDGVGRGADAREVSPDWLRTEYGMVVPRPDDSLCLYEGAPAGLVNPRRFVQAQIVGAELAGATVVADAVSRITRTAAGFVVSGQFGEAVANRVLLATGMYGSALVGVNLELFRQPRTTVRLEIEHGVLPSLIAYEVNVPDIEGIYWVPPVLYPNGKIMLKIGGTYAPSESIVDDAEIAGWFATDGNPAEASALRAVVAEILPDARVLSWDTVPCVVTQTASNYPSVGWIDDGIAVAVGGNGSAAKSSDEIGRRAASLFVPGMCDPADLQHFTPALQTPA